ncbi:GGDEF domain-containing protein [Amorphus coralli]|uniref:GGDEF domain-containing protein n=1 Tax=Amorphus coralli TaxID=340680 RepID=UPI000360EDF8|nr:sensor domain-containing diguanylate cyclase [Amorphus coralli]
MVHPWVKGAFGGARAAAAAADYVRAAAPPASTHSIVNRAAAAQRQRELEDLGLFNIASQEVFDRIGRIASAAFSAPTAFVSLLDAERMWIQTTEGQVLDDTPVETSLCIHTVQAGEMLVVEDARTDPRFATNPHVLGDPFVRFYAGAPLFSPNRVPVGTLCVVDRTARRFTPEQQTMLADLAALTMSQFELQRAALMDGLTGSWNRRMLEQVVSAEIRRSKRTDRKFALAMLDLDFFKRLNDEYGHAVGDEVLITFARLVRDNLRPEDWFFRLGGEEFAALIVHSSSAKAEGLIEQIRDDLARRGPAFGSRGVTFSSGITDHRPPSLGGVEGDTLATILQRADMALYEAKAAGRNRTVCAAQERVDA